MKHEIVTPKAPNFVLFLTKSFDAKEKGINTVHLFHLKVICFPRNIGFKFIVKFTVTSGTMYIL